MSVCKNCYFEQICKKEKRSCKALDRLASICSKEDFRHRRALIREYAKDLGVVNFEVSLELQTLGEQVIDAMRDLQFIKNYDIKVGYVMSWESKRSGRKVIFADCRKTTSVYTAFLPFHFIITFYWPNMSFMTDNQKKLLMYHELSHIGIGLRGLRLEPHDIDDFQTILNKYGLDWNQFGNDVPDILAGGGDLCKCSNTS